MCVGWGDVLLSSVLLYWTGIVHRKNGLVTVVVVGAVMMFDIMPSDNAVKLEDNCVETGRNREILVKVELHYA